ncbi:MAG TPA: hypothetical protein VFX86_03300 [Candidatus Saccharimonadales bacterium]|nr:hypothetical protein [Candidatus Saccharimonadales bacterium]
MGGIHEQDIDVRIHDFLSRKTRQYPELRMFENISDRDIQTRRKIDVDYQD